MSVLFHYICNVYMLPPERVTPFNIGSNVNNLISNLSEPEKWIAKYHYVL